MSRKPGRDLVASRKVLSDVSIAAARLVLAIDRGSPAEAVEFYASSLRQALGSPVTLDQLRLASEPACAPGKG